MQGLAHAVPFIALTRDGADLAVSNGSVRASRSGTPRIRYRLGRADALTMRQAVHAAARLHLESGAREVFTLHTPPVTIRHARDLAALDAASFGPNRVQLFTAHLNGTCRMGVDRRRSATSPEGERYGVRGLYVADGSLLPTAPGVNPQETILAIASRVAEGIVARR
jgi:choline dehydrogenase-like flavoprotein